MFDEARNWHCIMENLQPWEKRFAWPLPGEGWDKLSQAKKDALNKWCESAMDKEYPQLYAHQFMSFLRDGNRKVWENPYFERRRILMGAIFGECLQHSDERLDKVIDGLWLVCEETFWGLSAHNGEFETPERMEHPLPDKYNHPLDLFAAQTGALVAITLRLLRDRFDAVDTRIAVRLQKELEERIFTNFMDHTGYKWMGFHGEKLNNWTPWIVSSVMNAAAAAIHDDVRLSHIMARGMDMVDRWFKDMPDDGGLDEGIGYWNMAGGAFVDCLEVLNTITNGKITYYDNEKVRRIGNFPLMSYIGKGWHFNFADCDARPMMDNERIYTYGIRTNQPELAALGASKRTALIPEDTTQMNRTMDAVFSDMPEVKDIQPLKRVDYDKLQVWARSEDGLYAVIKGGNNDESHNHNDVGSFIVFADGEPVLIDAGNAVYTRQTFSEERYTLWHIRSMNHNVPMIGDCEQAAGEEHCAKNVQAGDDCVTMDIAAAYPAEAGVQTLQRTMKFGSTVELSDCIALDSDKPVTWVIMTRPEPEKLADGQLRVGPCVVTYPAELDFAYTTIEITDPRMGKCYPGKIYRMTFTAPAAKLQKAAFTVKKA